MIRSCTLEVAPGIKEQTRKGRPEGGRSNKPGATPRDKMNKMEKVAPEGQVKPMNEDDFKSGE